MNKKLQKYIAMFLLLPFLWGIVIRPALATSTTDYILTGIGLIASAFGGPLVFSIAVHAAIASISFETKSEKDAGTPPTTATGASFSIQLDPNTPIPGATPPGYSAGTASHPQPFPPSSMTKPAGLFTDPSGHTFTVFSDACHHAEAEGGTHPGWTLYTDTAPNCTYFRGGTNGYQNYSIIQQQGACPTGYTSSGTTTCAISTNPAVAATVQKPPDGKTAIVRTGNTFSPDVQDITDQVSPSSNIVQSTNSVEVTDSEGNKTTVLLNTDGTSSLTSVKTNATDNTTTTEKYDFSAPSGSSPGSVTVIGKSSSTVPGTGTQAGKGGVSTGPSGSGATGDSLDISSLNKEATQQQIRDALKPTEADITANTTLLGQITDAKNAADAAHTSFIDTFANVDAPGDLFTVSAPLAPGNCSVLTASFLGHPIVIDLCPYRDMIKEIAGYFLYMLTAAYLFQIFLRRPEGS